MTLCCEGVGVKSRFGPCSRASHNRGISELTSASKFVTKFSPSQSS